MQRELEPIISEIKKHKEFFRSKYKAEIIGIFGSYSRAEQNQSSDVDLLVRFFEGASLFDLAGLANFLEDVLQLKVDIVSERAVREELKEAIYNEVVRI
ncbi:MAG: nucleotidyltransferase family protein [Candidatus Heimdallarchaeota archaeon]|nr:nucleotidyltransferase family protein [Candidatus Heimdallarchaeota archaeon]